MILIKSKDTKGIFRLNVSGFDRMAEMMTRGTISFRGLSAVLLHKDVETLKITCCDLFRDSLRTGNLANNT